MAWPPPDATTVKVTLENVLSGERQTVLHEQNTVENLTFWYTEGNGACDCNRGIMFDTQKGIDTDLDEYACGAGIYRLVSIEDADSHSQVA